MINTFVATAAAILSWSAVEGMARGKASMLGAASGMVAGLVAITPACGFIGPMGAIVLGLIVSPICYFFVTTVKSKFGYDDSLDVFGVHWHRRDHRRAADRHLRLRPASAASAMPRVRPWPARRWCRSKPC